MCFGPEMLLAAGLSAAGSYVNARETNANVKRGNSAREASLRQELDRQKVFQDQAGQEFSTANDRFSPEARQNNLGDIIAKRQDALNGAVQTEQPQGYAAVPDSAPKVVKTDLAKRLAEAVGRSRQQAGALAKLGATSDLFDADAIGLHNADAKIGTIGNFASNSANVNQAEQGAAYQNAQKAPSGFGDLLGLAGMGLGLYSGFNGGSGSVFGDTIKGTIPPPGAQGPSQWSPWGKIKNWF